MLDIEYSMENAVNLIMSDLERANSLYRLTEKEQAKLDEQFSNIEENTNCSTSSKAYTRKLTI